jgi:hypothetical protein
MKKNEVLQSLLMKNLSFTILKKLLPQKIQQNNLKFRAKCRTLKKSFKQNIQMRC